MDSKAHYARVGAFVLLLLAAVVFLILWISQGGRHEVYKNYVTYAQGDVTGLTVDSPVHFNGVNVGYVASIALDRGNTQLVQINMKIQEGIPMRVGTIATLLPMGVTGILYVSLKETQPSSPILQPNAQGVYPPVPFHLSFLMQLGVVLPELTKQLATLSQRASGLLSDANIEHLSTTIKNIASFSAKIEKSAGRVDQITTSVATVLSNTEKASQEFPALVQQAKKDLDVFYIANQSANQGIQQAVQVLKQGSLLVQDMRVQLLPKAVNTLDRVNSMTESLSELLQEMQDNPSILIRGKQPPILGPGE